MAKAKGPEELNPVAYARRFTKSAIKTLVGIMQDTQETGQARISAAKEVLSRGWGQPAPSVNMAKTQMSDDQLGALAKAILDKRAKIALAAADNATRIYDVRATEVATIPAAPASEPTFSVDDSEE
jgi:hypothetical protein